MLNAISNNANSQSNQPYVRIANITIDSAKVNLYNEALKEHAEAAVREEAGVLTLYAVHDKKDATHVTVFEIYASEDAYQSHIKTRHFLKYKDTVKDMVKSLTLTDMVPIALQAKVKP
jgi:4-carboxymuconolactone decarboxylase